MTTNRSKLLTEQRLKDSLRLDSMGVLEAVKLMNRQDAVAVAATAAVAADVARAIDLVVAAFRSGGRLIYVGAGSSGRLGALDAAECPPTFGVKPQMVQAILAGGKAAMTRSREGAEDRPRDGAAAIDRKRVGRKDVVVGIAAGGTTPFVHGALAGARRRGAKTIFITCVKKFAGEPKVDLVIRPLTGPEVLTGSTRLKAGAATKLILNQITTISMVRLGKAYQNLMVDLRATNDKLWDRAARIVATVTGLPRGEAMKLLRSADGQVKPAILMHALKVDFVTARRVLARCQGRLVVAMASDTKTRRWNRRALGGKNRSKGG
jgi:N-acetylmuramic acid 6-phosphate etherase